MKGRPGVLVTRPAERSLPLIAALEAMGYAPVCNPLLAIEPTGAVLPAGGFDGIVFTSASAIPYCPARNVPVFTVGDATAEAAAQAGFKDITYGGADVATLQAFLSRKPELCGHTLLYPSGIDISQELQPEGVAIMRVPVYEARPLALQKTTIAHLYDGEINWIVLFSRRSAEAFGAAMTELHDLNWTAKTGLACLAASAAEALASYRWRQVAVAATPDLAGLLACLPVTIGAPSE